MSVYPIAENAAEALSPDAPAARTEHEAAVRARSPVYLAIQDLPGVFATIAEAERAAPGLYGAPHLELIAREDGYRVIVRFWRPAPAAPVARTAQAAARRPLGYARTPEEARVILGAPAERVAEPLRRPYATRSRAMAQIAKMQTPEGLAQIVEREGAFIVQLSYWRPVIGSLSPAERAEIKERSAAPLRAHTPQLPLDVGLFERLAPENPAIVLAEEGDGRGES
ncbi:MAG: hypothetical protein AB7M12_00825 [Hyphomonadaceae bacterium]